MKVTRLFDCIHHQLQTAPMEKSMGHNLNNQWTFYSTQEIITQAKALTNGLLQLGLKPQDKVAIIAPQNRVEWCIIDLALQQVGAISVPVYPTISINEYKYIFNDATVRYCFVGSEELYNKISSIQPEIHSLEAIFTFDKQPDVPHWEDLKQTEATINTQALVDAIQPTDVVTIIYTSGTTGFPKGVVLTHHNILTSVMGVCELLPLQPYDKVLSFLPVCHIFERAASYAYMYFSLSVHFVAIDNIAADLKAVQPHFFTTVPRLLEKVYDKIYAKGLGLTGIKRSLFFWALSLADSYEYDKTYSGWEAIKVKIADKLIFSKWREALGGNVKGIITGASQCPVKIARIFSFANIPVREGYGLTESSPGITINRFTKGGAKLGTVGLPVSGVEIMIDTLDNAYGPGEGEVLAAGDNIMVGYYNKPEETQNTLRIIDGKTWLCTGDIGTLIPAGGDNFYLKITDRKKELLKTSGGKYVAPAPIEGKLKENYLIDQAMVIGDGQKFTAALIVPAYEALEDWCTKNEITGERKDILQDSRVQQRYQQIIDKLNSDLNHVEQIKKFTLVAQPWEATKADGSEAELTPTMKLKRRVILKICAPLITSIYQ
ncbi:MAG: long-chain fatty acid--CoA ligase [Saprospiraceae bacterium]|nr:long-chain fatty acid--CoA ligase [Saprospiraceae bacterium]MBP7680103.1 long-chain fatty acid--CoA ligase [Saprospiraceae bacterium]